MNYKKINKENNKLALFWRYLPGSRFGIFRKFLASFLIISIFPLFIYGIYSYLSISRIGKTSIEKVKESIDEKTKSAIINQAKEDAYLIQDFLEKCEFYLMNLSKMPLTERTLLEFSRSHFAKVWLPDGNGWQSRGIKKMLPLFKEISFVAPNGKELIKVTNNKLVPKNRLKNVKFPKNTTYKSEKYFERTIKLSPGEIYVSHLNGFFVKPEEEFASLKDKKLLKIKKYYDGVIRFATPIYRRGRLLGILVLGLDHMHLMEFTQHILPNSSERILFPDYSSGDYAFMFDDEGWIITHPKFWDIRGVDSTGRQIPAYSRSTPSRIIEKGEIPFNLDSAGFVHPNYPIVAREVRKLNSGALITKNVGGTIKVMAYAPIIYNKGVYKKYGIFGGITIGSEIHKFRGAADIVSQNLTGKILGFRQDLFFFMLSTLIIVVLTAWFFSKSFSEPIRKLTETARKFAEGDFSVRVDLNRNDEIGLLANSFNVMAYEIRKNSEKLIFSFRELKHSKEKLQKYANDLEYQLKIISTIQSISNLLGKTFDVNFIIKEILKSCVEDIGFDRAILYLKDESGKFLEYKDMYGFTTEEEKNAKRSKYNINRHDCIETRVLKENKIIFVPNFKKYSQATLLDKKINKISGSKSFVYVPLNVKEEAIGVLGADKLRTSKRISKTDVNSIQILANQASRVIEIARLYKKIIEQRNFVNDVFNNMLNGLITLNANGEITKLNKAAEKILEIKSSKRKIKLNDLFPAEADLFNNIFNQLEAKGFFNGYNVEFKIGGKTKYLNLSVSRIESQDSEASIIAIIQDNTERKKLEESLQQMERLVSLGKFAAGIAHEIRNPLTGLSLFLDDLYEKLSSQKPLAKMLTQALNEIERLENLINEILDFAAPSTGKLKNVNLNELIDSTVEFVKNIAKKNRVEITIQSAGNLPRFKADAGKLRQAFLNILMNSIQAQPKGGKIKITTKIKKFSFGEEEKTNTEWIYIAFEDAGCGIADEDKPFVFEPFFTKSANGTGLGLAIVHTIVTEHGGKVFAENSRLGGAKFSIYLPIS